MASWSRQYETDKLKPSGVSGEYSKPRNPSCWKANDAICSAIAVYLASSIFARTMEKITAKYGGSGVFDIIASSSTSELPLTILDSGSLGHSKEAPGGFGPDAGAAIDLMGSVDYRSKPCFQLMFAGEQDDRNGSWSCDNAIWPPGARKGQLDLAGIGESGNFVLPSGPCLDEGV
jgi:hypothetical protein